MSNISRRRLTLSVVLRSPFIIPGPSVSATVADTEPARNTAGLPIIPYSLIRGLFRDAVQKAELPEVLAAFGKASGEEASLADTGRDPMDATGQRVGSNVPARRTLEFTDLVADVPPPVNGQAAPPVFTRIAIDSEGTGAGRDGQLQFIQLVAPLAREVTFTGTITCSATDPDRIIKGLNLAKELIHAVGSCKSSGFGEVISIKLSAAPTTTRPSVQSSGRLARHVDIAFAIDRPFVVNSERTNANQFKGAEIIPGAVLKGALANLVNHTGISNDQLARLRIGHAFPAVTGGAPARITPLSLALCRQPDGRRAIFDLLTAGRLDRHLAEGWSPPAFASDWKSSELLAILNRLGMANPSLRRDVRTRTAIDSNSNTARYDEDNGKGALFSYSAVCPDGHHWVSRWLVPDDISDEQLNRLEQVLGDGLPGIGKTRATATVVAFTPVADSIPAPLPGDFWALTLQTDAVLGNGSRDDYAAYWHNLGFRLINHFADQRLVGGYQALRYPARTDGYMPYVLTRAGSVFLLSGGDAAQVQELLRNGLPPVSPFDQRNWDAFPFGRENGYGAVELNMVNHAALLEGLPLTDKDGHHA